MGEGIMSMTEDVKSGQRLPRPMALELLHRQLAKPWLFRNGYDREAVLYLQAVTAKWASSAVSEGKEAHDSVYQHS
jgi:hypothetical protein